VEGKPQQGEGKRLVVVGRRSGVVERKPWGVEKMLTVEEKRPRVVGRRFEEVARW